MGKRGPAPKKIDWNEFDKLASYQCTQQEIASFFGISVESLEDLCLRDRGEKLSVFWDKRKYLGRVRLRKAQMSIVERAGPGAATMAIYLDKKMFPDETPRPPAAIPENPVQAQSINAISLGKKTFTEYCVDSGYPAPFPKQLEMFEFGINKTDPRLLLGSRGYGKTDYVVILGVGYDLYLHPDMTNLIMTKSRERNAAMVAEIAASLIKNGVELEKQNASCLRVKGAQGKDHSVSTVTIKTVSLRGRHPKRILMDDPVTEDDTSDATRLVAEKKFNELMKLVNNICVIGQPAHKYDLYAKLRPLLKKLEVPHGTIPELDHDLQAQRLAGVSEESIQASYFLSIMPTGTTPFDTLKYIDEFPEVQESVAFLDPSQIGIDATSLTIMHSWFDGLAAVGFNWKRGWNHCLDEVCAELARFKVKRLCVETNGLGDQPVLMLREMLEPYGVGVIGKQTVRQKHAKIMAAGSYAHLIYLSRQSHAAYTKEVVEYEYGAKHDDAPDSLSSCMEWLGVIRGKS